MFTSLDESIGRRKRASLLTLLHHPSSLHILTTRNLLLLVCLWPLLHKLRNTNSKLVPRCKRGRRILLLLLRRIRKWQRSARASHTRSNGPALRLSLRMATVLLHRNRRSLSVRSTPGLRSPHPVLEHPLILERPL